MNTIILGILICIAQISQSWKFNWYYNHNIHNFGNIGPGGRIHAKLASYSTKIIDKVAYKGENVRFKSLLNVREHITDEYIDILDIGCGCGMSTRSASHAFPLATSVIGMDCSRSMLKNCETHANDKIKYVRDFAHNSQMENESFDLINSMFLFHEAPRHARKALLNECWRLLRPGGYLNILDIRLNYEPNVFMLAGEPYLTDYLTFFQNDLAQSSFCEVEKKSSELQLDRLFVKKEPSQQILEYFSVEEANATQIWWEENYMDLMK